jgi:hypothetical protein
VSTCAQGFLCSATVDDCVAVGSTTTTLQPTSTTTLPADCGNGIVDGSEDCDEGGEWLQGRYCNADCSFVACADSNDDGATTAGDALFVLNTAVSLRDCDGCVCDVDGSGRITAGDALRVLKAALSLPIELSCPACQ